MQRIVIKNFGPIKDATIDLKNVTVLIGEQATGKSTVAQLVYFFRSIPSRLFANLNPNLSTEGPNFFSEKNSQIRKSLEIFISNFIKDKTNLEIRKIHKYNQNTEILFHYELKEERYIKIKNNNNSTIVTLGKGFDIQTLVNKIFSSAQLLGEMNIRSSLWVHLLNILPEHFHQSTIVSIYIPAGRNITTSFSNLFETFFIQNAGLQSGREMELMKDFMLFVSKLKDDINKLGLTLQSIFEVIEPSQEHKILLEKQIHIFNTILKGKYISTDGGTEKIETKDENKILLSNASSGQQEAIRIIQDLFLLTAKKEKGYRIIEEPEAHLFPDTQKALMEMLVTTSNATNSQFLITTHSPYILTALNNLLIAKQAAKYAAEQVENTGYPSFMQLEFNNISAYMLNSDGSCTNIANPTSQLIQAYYIDEISHKIGSDFDTLFEIITEHEYQENE